MLDRESTFRDPRIVELLKTRFVPVAIDQAYQRRQRDAEGDYYRKIANQGPRKVGRGTTQGLYVATADGRFLGFNNNRGPERVLRMMQQALGQYRPSRTAGIKPGKPDRRYVRVPPAGGLVVRVTTRVLGGYQPTEATFRTIFQQSLGRDNLWVRRDEHQALVRGELPESLLKRIARFHLVDNTRGEPPMWKPDEIRRLDVSLAGNQVTGHVELRTAAGDRRYKASLRGVIEVKSGRVTRFDLVAHGQFRGEGPYTRGAPKGEFPLANAFRLADGKDIADGVPPQGSKGHLDGYIR